MGLEPKGATLPSMAFLHIIVNCLTPTDQFMITPLSFPFGHSQCYRFPMDMGLMCPYPLVLAKTRPVSHADLVLFNRSPHAHANQHLLNDNQVIHAVPSYSTHA